MEDPVDSEVRRKIDEFGENMKKIFPNYKGIPVQGARGNFRIDHFDSNKKYKGSKYFYSPKKILFIHYTSIDSMLSILKLKKIRLFSLSAMDDVKELSYARNIIMGEKGMREEEEEKMKENRFAFSFCDYEVEKNEKSLRMWKEYGHDGYGCGIVFKIDTTQMENWTNFHLSKIYYDPKKLEPIKNAYKEYHDMQRSSDGTTISGFEDIIVSLYGFHKNPIFNYEREIRLLYVHQDFFNEKIFPYFIRGKKTSFIEFDLGYQDVRNEKANTISSDENRKKLISLPCSKPNINIANIVFGYRLTESDRRILTQLLLHYDPQENTNEGRIEARQSTLTKYYEKL